MSWVHRCMIVPTEHVELARALCAALAGDGGTGMFTTALSPNGVEPATHWISSGLIESEFADLLPLSSTPGQPDVVHSLALQTGMSVSIDDITGLLAAATISDVQDGVFSLLSEMGLQLVNEEPN